MIEALAIVFVLCVCSGLYLMAKVPDAARTPAERFDALLQHRAALQNQVQRGRIEGWDEVMLGQIEEQLQDVEIRIQRNSAR